MDDKEWRKNRAEIHDQVRYHLSTVNNYNDGIHGVRQQKNLRKNYLHWKQNKEAYAMADHDFDVGKNHPEEQLLVPEPLVDTNSNLDSSQPRKRRRVSSHPREISSQELEARIQNMPPDMKREIGSFLKPERKFMTHKESIDIGSTRNQKLHRKQLKSIDKNMTEFIDDADGNYQTIDLSRHSYYERSKKKPEWTDPLYKGNANHRPFVIPTQLKQNRLNKWTHMKSKVKIGKGIGHKDVRGTGYAEHEVSYIHRFT